MDAFLMVLLCSEAEGLRSELIFSILTADVIPLRSNGAPLSRPSSVEQGEGICRGDEGMAQHQVSCEYLVK